MDQWSTLVDTAAEHADAVLDDIQNRLQAAQIPGECFWSLDEVKSSGLFSRVRREFLVVRIDQFSDYRMYVAARPYGIHLDVCRFLTVEPGLLKKAVAKQLGGGDGNILSGPKNILVEQDLRAWITVVHHTLLDSVEALMNSLGQDTHKIRRESQGALSVW